MRCWTKFSGHDWGARRKAAGCRARCWPLRASLMGKTLMTRKVGLATGHISGRPSGLPGPSAAGRRRRGSVAVVDLSGKKKTLTQNWVSVRGLAACISIGDNLVLGPSAPTGLHAFRGRSASFTGGIAQLHILDTSPDGRVLVADESERQELMGRGAGDTKERRDLPGLTGLCARTFQRDREMGAFYRGRGRRWTFLFGYLRNMDGSPAVRLGDGGAIALTGREMGASVPTLTRCRYSSSCFPPEPLEPRH